MKTFYDFIEDEKIRNTNFEINENLGVGARLLGLIPRTISAIGGGLKLLGRNAPEIAGGALAGASAVSNLGTNDSSKSLAGADSENEIENILSSKIKESEKLLKSKLETHFKNFSINLSTNLNKIIKTNMEEFKKKIDTALADFIA
jgi:hypothetical protein